jgi:hypothetical protein
VLRCPVAAFINPLGEAVEPQDDSPHAIGSFLFLRLTLSPACLDTIRAVFSFIYTAAYNANFRAVSGAVSSNAFGTIFDAIYGSIFGTVLDAVCRTVLGAVLLHTSRLCWTDGSDRGRHVREVAIVDDTSVVLIRDCYPVRTASYVLSKCGSTCKTTYSKWQSSLSAYFDSKMCLSKPQRFKSAEARRELTFVSVLLVVLKPSKISDEIASSYLTTLEWSYMIRP